MSSTSWRNLSFPKHCDSQMATELGPPLCSAGDLPRPAVQRPALQWKEFTLLLGADGNVQHVHVDYDGAREVEVLKELAGKAERIRKEEQGVDANLWKIIYCLCPETDMIRVDGDGTRFRERAGMSRSDLEWALEG